LQNAKTPLITIYAYSMPGIDIKCRTSHLTRSSAFLLPGEWGFWQSNAVPSYGEVS
jgi:hypothetical protein